MNRLAAHGEADELARFRKLAGATIIATFALTLIGGTVRVSDSGLGCGAAGSGTHGWPLCEGGLLPNVDANAIVEFSHRLTATVVVVLIAAMAWIAWRRLRSHTWLVRGTIAAGILVLAQAVLGGVTVENDLHEYLVAAHLGLAMLLLGLLLALRRGAMPELPRTEGSRALRVLALTSVTLVLCTIVAGGVVAGTEGEGTATEPVVGAHLACGEQFPTCLNGSFMPFGSGRLVDIQLTHRLFMYLASISVLAMAAVALRDRVRERAFYVAVGVLLAQVLLGALNVWLGKHPGLIVAHLALGTTLWATVVYAATTLAPAPAPERREVRGPETATGTVAA
jgi:cytochrome c oxidase assembly protein subunit 15